MIKKKVNNDDKSQKGHIDQVYCLALTTDFKFLVSFFFLNCCYFKNIHYLCALKASGGKDTNIHIWDPTSLNHIYTFYGHRDAVSVSVK